MPDIIDDDLPNNGNRAVIDHLLATKWVIPLLRILFKGPARFTHLKSELPGLSANILSARLRFLQDIGLVRHFDLPAPASCKVYELTKLAQGARPILEAIDVWIISPREDPLKVLPLVSNENTFKQ